MGKTKPHRDKPDIFRHCTNVVYMYVNYSLILT